MQRVIYPTLNHRISSSVACRGLSMVKRCCLSISFDRSGLRNYNSIETMKSSRWLTAALLLLQLAANEAFLFSLGLVGLSVVGLASLKVCYGMKVSILRTSKLKIRKTGLKIYYYTYVPLQHECRQTSITCYDKYQNVRQCLWATRRSLWMS